MLCALSISVYCGLDYEANGMEMMSNLHLSASMFIPKIGQVAPLLTYGFPVRDKVYAIYMSPAIDYSQYDKPAIDRFIDVINLSKRNVISIRARKKA